MKYLALTLSMFSLLFQFCSVFTDDYNFSSNQFQLSIDKDGFLTEFVNKSTGENFVADNQPSPFIQIRVQNDELIAPDNLVYNNDNNLVFSFKGDIEATVEVIEKESHVTFELVEINKSDEIDVIVWGPYPTILDNSIGETVGVAQGENYTIGIQSLNPKTLGGYPWNENDCLPQIDIFDQEDLSDLKEGGGKRYVLFRVEAAKPEDFGSTLQAYSRNRNEDRVIENWGHERYTAPAFDDGGVTGSKIALFGCPNDKTLEIISMIELAEGLPHPELDGVWSKVSPAASSAYIILDFAEEDIDNAIEITKKAGLNYLYHADPFKTWGNFKLKEDPFPDGIESLRRCVETAEESGIKVGVHTLSNFITTNDAYVTPVPDKRLAKVGSSTITGDIDEKQTTIPIESPDFFNQFKNNHLKTVVIGDELIRYGSVSENAPWMLLDCQRGSFGTKTSSYKKGDQISKLADHAYKVFLTNPELSIEMSENIAELYNQTGLRQISFDGLEGNRSTGLGNYGEILFTQTWFDNLNENIKEHYIADASRTSHYFWHMYTRMNWGEPWYAGFRESQTEIRLKNQPYFKRNFMPAMLGWFKMTPETSIEDIEWMLARSAAFNAGYAFVTSYATIENNRHADEILKLLGIWEKARISGAFNEILMKEMEDINTEFHLESIEDNKWNLFRIYSNKFKHEKKVRQPGEPLYSTFAFENPTEQKTMNFILTAVNGDISKIKMELDQFKEVILPITLNKSETIKYSGGEKAYIYNKNWKILREIDINPSDFAVSEGSHNITFDCEFKGSDEAFLKIELRFAGSPEIIEVK